MFRTASAAGLRPASADLPPTLQPMAITQAAPRTDKRAAILGALAIYGCMPLALMAAGRHLPSAPPIPITHTEPPVFDLDPPSFGGPPTPAIPAGGPASSPVALPSLPAQNAPRADETSFATPAALPLGPQTPEPLGHPGGQAGRLDQNLDGSNVRAGIPGGGHSGAAGPVDFTATGLQVLKQVDPAYPPIARATRVQGLVVLRMVVDERGMPIAAEVLEGHPLLRAEALRAARQWQFVPARMGGEAVPASFLLTLKFRLI